MGTLFNLDLIPWNFKEKPFHIVDNEDLYVAFKHGNIESMKEAIANKKVDLETWESQNLMHIAAFYGLVDIVDCVGPSKDLLVGVCPNGDTPLIIASREGHVVFVKKLVGIAKELSFLESTTPSPFDEFLVDLGNAEGNTALHESARYNHIEVVEFLMVEYPSAVSLRNIFGETPIFLAVERGYVNVVRKILDHRSSIDFGAPFGLSALHVAVICNNEDIVSMLLHHSLFDVRDENGWAPIHYACHLGLKPMVKLLLDHSNSAAYMRDRNGRVAIHLAAAKGHLSIVKLLLSLVPDCFFIVDDMGRNVLHISILNGQDKVVKFLMNNDFAGYLVNQSDKKLNTPLHLSVAKQIHFPLLMNNERTDVLVRNERGETALDIQSHLLGSMGKLWGRMTGKGHRPTLARVRQGIETDYRELEEGPEGISGEGNDKEKNQRVEEIHSSIATLVTTLSIPDSFSFYSVYSIQSHSEMERLFFNVFVAANTFAMVASLSALVVFFLQPVSARLEQRANYLRWGSALTIASVGAMDVAIGSGSLAILPLRPGIIGGVISTFFFVLYIMFVSSHYSAFG